MAARPWHTLAMAGASCCSTPASSAVCCWSAIAENVGSATPSAAMHWPSCDSAPHRASMLDLRMRQVGVGVVEPNGSLWVTEVFRYPR